MKRVILIFCSVFLLFNLYGCASNTPTPEQQQILKATEDVKQLRIEIQDKTAKMDEALKKFNETYDKKYVDEAQQYSDELDVLKEQAQAYIDTVN